jgi:hypothetical protein
MFFFSNLKRGKLGTPEKARPVIQMWGKQQVQMRTREVEVEPEANDSQRMKGDLT